MGEQLWNDWGDGQRGETVVEAAPQLTADEAKAFPIGADWGDGERTLNSDTTREPESAPGSTGDDGANPIGFVGELPESFDDDDREIVSHFFSGLEGQLSPELAQQILSRYSDLVDAQDGATEKEDEAAAKSAAAILRQELGDEFDTSRETLREAIMSEEFGEDLLDARFADDTAIFNDPGVFRWLSGMARDQARYRELRERMGEE